VASTFEPGGPTPATALGDVDHHRRDIAIRAIAVVGLTLTVGVLTAVNPPVTLLLVLASLAMIGLLLVGKRIATVFLGGLAIILIGYAFLGRGFAHIGGGPIYISELMLPVAILAWLRCRQPGRFGPVSLLLVAFMAWGALQTIPYIPRYGFDALRDAVTWGYGIYALVIAAILRDEHLRAGVRLYARLILPFLLWVPIAMFLVRVVPLPLSPGAEVTIIDVKGGDLGVLLGAIGAFILVGLYATTRTGFQVPEPVLWGFWLIAVAVAGIINRGGLVAAATVGATIFYVRAATRWLVLIFVALALVVPLILIDPRIQVGDEEFSVGSMVTNVTSVFGDAEVADLEGTERFRIAWWSKIVDYTIGGQYFLAGKGYGVNLADDDGFQPTADKSLRAPHNVHMEVLARSGVPGLILWILLQVSFAWALLRGARRASVLPDPWWTMILGWIFIHWLAALVNASFDPYLQGPQGGIWFWAMFGVGLAAMRMSEDAIKDADLAPERPAGVAS
jgi:O-Antigen ligase